MVMDKNKDCNLGADVIPPESFTGDKKVFDRVEKKCLITKKQKTEMLKVIKEKMQKDKYYISDVYNIYFDTENFDLIIQSIEQPMFKEKLRARSYGGYDKVFFEIKTKLCGKDNNVGYKRRVRVTKKDYKKIVSGNYKVSDLIKDNADGPNDFRIAEEVDYLIDFFGLKPMILVFYRRESYQGEGGLRITFDEKLKYRTENIGFSKRKIDNFYFEDEKNIIMEIKAHGAWPLWLARKMSQERIFPEQFSKVGKIYQKIGKELKNV